jgi:hypothetical protein
MDADKGTDKHRWFYLRSRKPFPASFREKVLHIIEALVHPCPSGLSAKYGRGGGFFVDFRIKWAVFYMLKDLSVWYKMNALRISGYVDKDGFSDK